MTDLEWRGHLRLGFLVVIVFVLFVCIAGAGT
jgi:hypothetical protein